MNGIERLPMFGVKAVEAPLQCREPFLPDLLRASTCREAREAFQVDGTGTTIALLGTGLRTAHGDFTGRIAAQWNFTPDNGGDEEDASDGHGHGTHVAGILCGGGIHVGVAPGARIVPLKMLSNDGSGSFRSVADALQWVIERHAEHGISALCIPFGDGGNHRSDAAFSGDAIGLRIAALTEAGIACCVAAGCDYFGHRGVQGMAYPAIFRDTLSIGSLYDGDDGGFRYDCGAEAFGTGPDRIAPYSQRLHQKAGGACATDVFAPGTPMVSSGLWGDGGESIQAGTSLAAPLVAGIVLLLQSLYKRSTGGLPTVAQLRRWLLRGAIPFRDSDDEQDNVLHTGLSFSRVDALGSLRACAREATRNLLEITRAERRS